MIAAEHSAKDPAEHESVHEVADQAHGDAQRCEGEQQTRAIRCESYCRHQPGPYEDAVTYRDWHHVPVDAERRAGQDEEHRNASAIAQVAPEVAQRDVGLLAVEDPATHSR